MKIKEFEKIYEEQVKDLLVELQEYIIEIDVYKLNIISKMYREEYFNFMLKDCSLNEGKFFVAKENNKVVGFVAGFVEKYSPRDLLDYSCPKKGIIAELIVNKKYRSNGVGNLLIKHIEDYFKQIGCEFVQLDLFAYNQTAKKFYNKHGYSERMVTMFKKI